MDAAIRKLIVGNWKMNGLGGSLSEVSRLVELLAEKPVQADVVICPPATLIERAAAIALPAGIAVGGQDCHDAPAGAHTGDISAAMLADCGARYVIVGHSERRTNHGESDAIVAAKAGAAIAAGLIPIICVGETEPQRLAGNHLEVVSRQLRDSVPPAAADHDFLLAYEPVWAIGTGRTPTEPDVGAMHAEIRKGLRDRFATTGDRVPILYGGSVKPANAGSLLAIESVNGALVGGASLLANDFFAIISAS